ncbi:MAG TPA: serine hydrolase domain-containing protein [Nannocystaceae bacterium]|nr:serine hydrolase domain-containing protein [Nannocystaceae bacterium]
MPEDARQTLFDLLDAAVQDGVFPGCIALVSRDDAVVYHEGHGTLGSHPSFVDRFEPVGRDTAYDLASLTKVLATTTLAAVAVAQGQVELDAGVPEPWSRACPGATLADLLEHCAGLEAHREYFLDVAPFDAEAVLARVCETPPAAAPRERAVYSDLGFMILGAWLERLFDAPLDHAFVARVAYPSWLDQGEPPALAFRRLHGDAMLPSSLERLIAPTEVYDAALHPDGVPSHFAVRAHVPVAHGSVHDDNAYVMGGVAGHAGLFGTAGGVHELARAWLQQRLPDGAGALRDRFWRASTVPGSTRRLGWDGAAPDGSGATADAFGPDAIGHTGYTGTSLWIDPSAARGPLICVLLTNRVHPSRTNDAIKAFRQRFHGAAAKL